MGQPINSLSKYLQWDEANNCVGDRGCKIFSQALLPNIIQIGLGTSWSK